MWEQSDELFIFIFSGNELYFISYFDVKLFDNGWIARIHLYWTTLICDTKWKLRNDRRAIRSKNPVIVQLPVSLF